MTLVIATFCDALPWNSPRRLPGSESFPPGSCQPAAGAQSHTARSSLPSVRHRGPAIVALRQLCVFCAGRVLISQQAPANSFSDATWFRCGCVAHSCCAEGGGPAGPARKMGTWWDRP